MNGLERAAIVGLAFSLLQFTFQTPASAAAPTLEDWEAPVEQTPSGSGFKYDGWNKSTIDGELLLQTEDGNPGGYLRVVSEGSIQNVGISSSQVPEFRGDFGAAGILSMSVDVRKGFFEPVNSFHFRIKPACITCGNGWQYVVPAFAIGETWSTISAPLDASWTDGEASAHGWLKEGDSQQTFAELLADVGTVIAQGVRPSNRLLNIDFDNFTLSTETVEGSSNGASTNPTRLHVETFDTINMTYGNGDDVDYNGWGRTTTQSTITHMTEGGNPNGFVRVQASGSFANVGVDNQLDDRVQGNYVLAGVGEVSVDIRNLGAAINTIQMRFRTNDSSSTSPPDTIWTWTTDGSTLSDQWTTIAAPLDPTWSDVEAIANGWAKNGGTGSFSAAFSNINDVAIQGYGVGGTARTLDFDNFTLAEFTIDDGDPGDANRDGTVDRRDVVRLLSRYATLSDALFDDGDFNDDQKVTLADLAILQRYFGEGSANSPLAAVVPEPASGAIALIGALALLRVRVVRWRRFE